MMRSFTVRTRYTTAKFNYGRSRKDFVSCVRELC